MALHKDLTGLDLHEPKGADAAVSGAVYTADGAGSGDWTVPQAPGVILLETITAANSASMAFSTDTFIAGLSHIEFAISGLMPGSANDNLLFEISYDGGASWQTANYSNANQVTVAGSGLIASTGYNITSAGILNHTSNGPGTGSGFGWNGKVSFFQLTGQRPCFFFNGVYYTSSPVMFTVTGSGAHIASTAVNAVRFRYGSSVCVSGEVSSFGFMK